MQTKVKLYSIPRGSKVYVGATDGSEYIIFNRLDGAYSHCTTENGETVHLSATTPLEEYKDGYKITE